MLIRDDMPLGAELDWLGDAQATVKRKRGHPERSVQVTGKRWLDTVLPIGSVVFAIKNEAVALTKDRRKRFHVGQARKAEGVKTGFPDMGAALPAGAIVWVEWKAPGGVLSAAQVGIHAQLRSLGHIVIVATCIETCRHGLLAAGIKLREVPGLHRTKEVQVRTAKPRNRLPADLVPF